jgi:hypothetical protein
MPTLAVSMFSVHRTLVAVPTTFAPVSSKASMDPTAITILLIGGVLLICAIRVLRPIVVTAIQILRLAVRAAASMVLVTGGFVLILVALLHR